MAARRSKYNSYSSHDEGHYAKPAQPSAILGGIGRI
jgi:hypothetical protein